MFHGTRSCGLSLERSAGVLHCCFLMTIRRNCFQKANPLMSLRMLRLAFPSCGYLRHFCAVRSSGRHYAAPKMPAAIARPDALLPRLAADDRHFRQLHHRTVASERGDKWLGVAQRVRPVLDDIEMTTVPSPRCLAGGPGGDQCSQFLAQKDAASARLDATKKISYSGA